MKSISAFDHVALTKQLELQKKHAWNLEQDFLWSSGIDLEKPFVPMDENNIAFPGASLEQRIALSQMIGLMVNETICEMECSLPRLKFQAWEQHLRRFPVNPEMFALGELFFEEEEKHAESFKRFLHISKICKSSADHKNIFSIFTSTFSEFLQAKVDQFEFRMCQNTMTALKIAKGDLASARKIAHRVAMLHGGEIIWHGPRERMTESGNPYVDQFVQGSAEGPIR